MLALVLCSTGSPRRNERDALNLKAAEARLDELDALLLAVERNTDGRESGSPVTPAASGDGSPWRVGGSPCNAAGLPKFETLGDLERDEVWSAYLKLVYGGLPDTGSFPLCLSDFDQFYTHVLKHVGGRLPEQTQGGCPPDLQAAEEARSWNPDSVEPPWMTNVFRLKEVRHDPRHVCTCISSHYRGGLKCACSCTCRGSRGAPTCGSNP